MRIKIKGYLIEMDKIVSAKIFKKNCIRIDYEEDSNPSKIVIRCDSEDDAKDTMFSLLKKMVTKESSSEEL